MIIQVFAHRRFAESSDEVHSQWRAAESLQVRFAPMTHGRVWDLVIAMSLLALLAATSAGCGDERAGEAASGSTADSPSKASPRTLQEWTAERDIHERTTWADEMLAQEYERTIVSLWDALLAASRKGDPRGKVEALSSVEFDSLQIGRPRAVEQLPHGIKRFEFETSAASLTHREWEEWLNDRLRDGFVLVQSEWHHARFDPPTDTERAARDR